ncbi:MAG: hypothetical protein PHN75_19990 [Syntrophales bacterium]|nr:hypothetical protein [Syntrophales bacterium]
MPKDIQVSGIMFADVVNSSPGKQDQQTVSVQPYLEEFLDKKVSADACLFRNAWGDGVLLACGDPNDALEYALKLRAWFKVHNWKRDGFAAPLDVRAGLHAERILLEKKGGKVSGCSGKHIVLKPRMEPIVPGGCIYCTEIFYLLVKDEIYDFIQFRDLGARQLAKSFPTARLFEVFTKSDAGHNQPPAEPPSSGAAIPTVQKEFTDAEIDGFLEDGFRYICDYFKKASRVLQESDKDLEVRTKMISETILTAEVFVEGTSRARCRIWLSKDMFGKGILYSQSSFEFDSSYNESLSVAPDGDNLSFKCSGMLGYCPTDPLSHHGAAELYWQGLIKQLQ